MVSVVRLAGAAAVAVAILLLAGAAGRWLPQDPVQAALTLVLTTVLVQLGLGLRFGAVGAGPVADMVGLGVTLTALLGGAADAPALECVQFMMPSRAAWALFLVGAGSVVVAGSSGVLLVVDGVGWRGRHLSWIRGPALRALMTWATLLTLVALGTGLVVTLWWAWRSVGTSPWDPRQGGVAVVWLLAAMSLLAGHLRSNGERWAAVLTTLAAIAALLGLLVL
jgi:hypothetical protein